MTDRNGIPLVVGLTAANVNDCKLLKYMLDHLPSLRNLVVSIVGSYPKFAWETDLSSSETSRC